MSPSTANLGLAIKHCLSPVNQNLAVLHPHLGLGDSILCLGLVRELSRREPATQFYFACLHRCYQSLAWMFQDLNNVFLFAVNGGGQAKELAGFLNARYLPIGIDSVELGRFDAFFYEQHQVPFDYRWSDADVPPGPQAESLYAALNPKDEPYLLVCNSVSNPQAYELKIENPQGKKIITLAPHTNNIFDWAKLIERADQIHTIDTAFVHLVESQLFSRSKDQAQDQSPDKQTHSLFYHLARQSATEFTRRLPWQIIAYR